MTDSKENEYSDCGRERVNGYQLSPVMPQWFEETNSDLAALHVYAPYGAESMYTQLYMLR